MLNFLRHLFIPHQTNNFRAKVLQLDFFALYVFIFFLFSLSFRTIHKLDPNILGFATDIHVDQLLSLTNQKRLEAGLSPLNLNAVLAQAAIGKANDMFAKGYWAHNSPDGKTPWDFINGVGYIYTVAGENLAKNFSNSGGIVDAWMNSPTHRDNILRDQYQDIGFAVVNGVLNGEETTLVVQMFGKPVAQVAQVQAPVIIVSPSPVPVVAEAQAEEVEREVFPGSEAEIVKTERSEPATAAAYVTPEEQLPQLEISPLGQSVVRAPFLDIGRLTKKLTLALSTMLMLVLVLDGIYVWHHKIARAGGKTMAHLLFLFLFTGVIWFMSFGSIL